MHEQLTDGAANYTTYGCEERINGTIATSGESDQLACARTIIARALVASR